MTTLDPAVKAQWVADLTSGEYAQSYGALHKKDGFCCLGVLVDRQYVKTGWGCWDFADFPDDDRYTLLLAASVGIHRSIGNSSYLPNDSMVNQGNQDILSGLNDRGTPFPAIATWIEENL